MNGKKLPTGHHVQMTKSAYNEYKKTGRLTGMSYMGGPKPKNLPKPIKHINPEPKIDKSGPNQIPGGRYNKGKLAEGTVDLLKKRKQEREERLAKDKESRFQPKAKTQVLSKKMGGQPVRQAASNIVTTAKNIVGKAKFNRDQRVASGKSRFSLRKSS